MTFISEGQPPHKTRPFPIKTKVQFGFQVPGMYISDSFQPASFSTTKGHVKSQSMITIVRHRWQTWSFGFLGDAGKHEITKKFKVPKMEESSMIAPWRDAFLLHLHSLLLSASKTGANLFAPQHHTGTGSKKNHDPKATTSWFLNDGNGFPAKPGWPGTMVLEWWFLVDDPYLTGGWTTHLKKYK